MNKYKWQTILIKGLAAIIVISIIVYAMLR